MLFLDLAGLIFSLAGLFFDFAEFFSLDMLNTVSGTPRGTASNRDPWIASDFRHEACIDVADAALEGRIPAAINLGNLLHPVHCGARAEKRRKGRKLNPRGIEQVEVKQQPAAPRATKAGDASSTMSRMKMAQCARYDLSFVGSVLLSFCSVGTRE